MLKYDESFILPIIKDYADDGKLNDKKAYDNISLKYKIDLARKVLK